MIARPRVFVVLIAALMFGPGKAVGCRFATEDLASYFLIARLFEENAMENLDFRGALKHRINGNKLLKELKNHLLSEVDFDESLRQSEEFIALQNELNADFQTLHPQREDY
jgi:hypothetical protein